MKRVGRQDVKKKLNMLFQKKIVPEFDIDNFHFCPLGVIVLDRLEYTFVRIE